MENIHEVITDYTDDQNYTHIDVYNSEDQNESGQTVAIVCNDTYKVFYIDNMYRNMPIVTDAIDSVLSIITKHTQL